MTEQADARKLRDTQTRARPDKYSFRGGGFLFFLTDGALLLGALVTSQVLLEDEYLDLTAPTFIGMLLLVQFCSELRHPHRADLSVPEETATVFRRVCIAYALASGVALVSGSGDLANLLALAVATVPLLLVGRSASYALEKSRRRKGHRSRALVLGGGAVAERVVSALRSCPEFGLELVGVVDEEPKPAPMRPTALFLGTLNELPKVIDSHSIDTIIVAFAGWPRTEFVMTELLRTVLSKGTNVWVIPRFYEFGMQGQPCDDLWGLPIIKLTPPGPDLLEWPLKRALDVVVAGIGLLIAAPFMAISAVLILVESGRPVLFRQRRVGVQGGTFDILKFRTMAACSDEINETEWVADGQRTTKIGKILRSSGLDELPQLFNVLKGEMSIVGPRPERPFFVERFVSQYPGYQARHRVAGGITGLSQICGLRGDTSIEYRAAADNRYIDTWRVSTDLKIILRSLPSLIRDKELPSLLNADEDAPTLQPPAVSHTSSIDLTESSPDDSPATVGRRVLH